MTRLRPLLASLLTAAVIAGAEVDYEIAPTLDVPDEWRVEAIDYDNEGQVYVTIFSGPKAEERAVEYASFKNGTRFWGRYQGLGQRR